MPIDQRAGSPAVQRLSAFEYRYLTEFQSHEPEFDYLKSLEIEEKINQVRTVEYCARSKGDTNRTNGGVGECVQQLVSVQPMNGLRAGEVVSQLQWLADAAVDERQDHQAVEGDFHPRLLHAGSSNHLLPSPHHYAARLMPRREVGRSTQVFEKKMVTLTGFNTDPAAAGALSSPGWSISARRALHPVWYPAQCCKEMRGCTGTRCSPQCLHAMMQSI